MEQVSIRQTGSDRVRLRSTWPLNFTHHKMEHAVDFLMVCPSIFYRLQDDVMPSNITEAEVKDMQS